MGRRHPDRVVKVPWRPRRPFPEPRILTPFAPSRLWGMETVRPTSAAPPAVRDAVLLLTRLGVGIAFAAHGWQKLNMGLDGVTAGMAKNGVPLPRASAIFATFVELGAGIALVLGALTAVAGILLATVMTGAFAFVHFGRNPFVKDGGWELVAALGTAALLVAVFGPGRLSVDHLVSRARAARRREVVLEDGDGRTPDVDVRAEERHGAPEPASR